MTGPRQPRTCSHLINAQTLTGVCQVVRMFSPCQFHVKGNYFQSKKLLPVIMTSLPVGVVVNVSELLLMSLAKMTVQVGKTIGQAVGDSKVRHVTIRVCPKDWLRPVN